MSDIKICAQARKGFAQMKKGKAYGSTDKRVFRYTAGRTHKKNLDHKIAPRGGERH